MARPGETYTAARRHVVAAAPGPLDGRPDQGGHPELDHAPHLPNGDCTDLPGTRAARRRGSSLARRAARGPGARRGPTPTCAGSGPSSSRLRAPDDRGEGSAHVRASATARWPATATASTCSGSRPTCTTSCRSSRSSTRLVEARGVDAGRITLICVGEHAGIARFGGLGELSAEQLRGAATTDAAAPAHAVRAGAGDAGVGGVPGPVAGRASAAVAATRSLELRFLGEAFDRLAREYPSTRDGLSLTERRILAAAADGALDAGSAFDAGRRPRDPALPGRHLVLRTMARLARAPVPLLRTRPGRGPRSTRVTAPRLTAAGARVLAGLRRPRRAQRHRPLDRRRPPGRPGAAVAMARGSRAGDGNPLVSECSLS